MKALCYLFGRLEMGQPYPQGEETMGILTRGRGRKKCDSVQMGDPKKLRFRRGNGNNRSKKRQAGFYQILRGEKAAQTAPPQ
ncbi:MAG TPA: hypothetical protein VMH91_00270 [Candidatus Paceibacterota bacterium]|nr:hypothetical protein [Candidatus Paceibacterota bacterium]